MSDVQSPGKEPTGQHGDVAKPQKQKKGRSTGERIIVWSLIGLLAVFAAVEGLARYGFTQTVAALEPVADSADGASFPLNEVVHGLPLKSGPEREGLQQWVVTYRWPSLVKNYEIRVTVDSEADDAQVVAFMTPEADVQAADVDTPPGDPGDPGPEMPSGPGAEPGEPGGEKPDESGDEKPETSGGEKSDESDGGKSDESGGEQTESGDETR